MSGRAGLLFLFRAASVRVASANTLATKPRSNADTILPPGKEGSPVICTADGRPGCIPVIYYFLISHVLSCFPSVLICLFRLSSCVARRYAKSNGELVSPAASFVKIKAQSRFFARLRGDHPLLRVYRERKRSDLPSHRARSESRGMSNKAKPRPSSLLLSVRRLNKGDPCTESGD